MDVSAISSSATGSPAALIQESAGILVMRKMLDMEAAQGAMLAQMVAQSAGLGQNVDTRA